MGIWGGLLGAAIFFVKVMLCLLIYVWTRATFPRFRFDQLMDLGWKFMITLALANIFVTGIFILAGQERLMYWIGIVTIALIVFYLRPRRARAPQKVVHAS
jgi:NADH-quinone oxidoreductase subunit H